MHYILAQSKGQVEIRILVMNVPKTSQKSLVKQNGQSKSSQRIIVILVLFQQNVCHRKQRPLFFLLFFVLPIFFATSKGRRTK